MPSNSLAIAIICLLLTCACSSNKSLRNDSPQFRAFIESTNSHAGINALEDYLIAHHVQNVVPIGQLLKQGTAWQSNRQPAYAIPPQALWPRMVVTLKLMQRFVIPAIGPIEVVSGFRTQRYNRLAGGAPRSQHLEFSALDVIPKYIDDRNLLHHKLLILWNQHGRQLNMGLGLYGNTRFHIDTGGYRKWRG